MITVQNMHETILAFAKMQGVDIKEGGDKFSIRLILPSDALNALMSDFNERPVPPTWKTDEDKQFYAKVKFQNISLVINEGLFYRLENIPGNQIMEAEFAGDDPVLPGRAPHIDHKKKY